MDPAKVAAIRDWITPTKKKDIQAFIGFCNFYRRFIQDFSKIARPLHDLTKKDAPWRWDSAQQQAFDALKDKITSAPVLAMPRDDGQYRVEADASDYAVGAVLSQLQDGAWHPVAYLSKTLNAAERNYEIYDKEMLAIMTALEEWRHYLLGTKEPFDIWTDHQNLTYFREARKLNRRQARWFTELQDYHFILTHRPGKTMGKPDALSRNAVENEGLHDNENVVLLKPELFRLLLIQATVVDVQGVDHQFFERIRDSNAAIDDKVSKALAEDKQHLRWSQRDDGVIITGSALYVPRDNTLRADILKAHHDTQMAGHPGEMKMFNLIRSSYFWPGLRHDVKRYVKSCSICQAVKIDRQPRHAPLHPHAPPAAPFEVIGVDFVGPLPESEDKNMICVITDHFTKFVIYTACRNTIDSEELARLYSERLYGIFGMPRRVISDRGSVFVSEFTRTLMKIHGIEGNPSTAHHPQTDGQTERQNQELEAYLRIWVSYHQDDWVRWLPDAQFWYNNVVHSATVSH